MSIMNPIIVQHIKNFLNRASPRIRHSRDDHMIDFISPEFSEFFYEIDTFIKILGNAINCANCSNKLSIDWKVCVCLNILCQTCIECSECNKSYDLDRCAACGTDCGAYMCRFCRD